MIDWNKVEEDIKKLAHSARYEIGTTEEHAEVIFNYIKSLIEEEFKLLVKFNYEKELNMSEVIWQRIQDLNLEDNQNISIYINESKKELPKFKDIIGLFNK